ncbi:phage major tail tube protein [Pseudoalteromonas luteoviolacea]|uniref:Major tail tube protein n=1 Tax=Pseudoalteromonas luteoviolacea NCIMB 1942 TaxID=1365253 RepID=A0A166Z6X4_9GAMM|nr:phage major tail tube protein [Pseudoalteromonas luteoviolacea]KZN44001.1 major tail tube protein [Pseudoalteromonas luteoviolacea NCIMB 1942]
MALPRKLKGLNVFVDGQHYVGEVEEVTPAKLTRKFEGYRSGGMPGSVQVDMGYDDSALDLEFTLGGVNVDMMAKQGTQTIDGIQLRFAGAIQRDDTGEVQSLEIVCRGRFKEFDPGTYKPGDNSTTKVTMINTYYKLIIDGRVIREIDLVNFIDIPENGIDAMAPIRQAIGL